MKRAWVLGLFVGIAHAQHDGVSSLYVYTENSAPITSTSTYVNGSLKLYDESGALNLEGAMQIRGRGNSTWGMPKKPYKIKLNTRAEMLGMPSDKEWALLANYSDKTLLRNRLAFELGRRLGMANAPRSRHVELYRNDEYRGVYLLTETIKVGTSRVNIAKLDPSQNTPELITGGYLVEVDGRMDDDHCFRSDKNIAFCIKEPSPISNEQLSYIQNYILETERAIFASNFDDPNDGYAKYLDADSFIDWFIVNEGLKNNDAAFWSSVYFYKDRGGKLKMGPVWDFDIGAGNIDYSDALHAEGWWVRGTAWFSRLFQDPNFEARVRNRWAAVYATELDSLDDYIDASATTLDQSQQRNFLRWDILNTDVWPNPYVFGSYAGEINYLKGWLNKRLAWMNQQFTN